MQIGSPGPPISHISQAYPDRVEVRGRDLTGDLMGRLSFTEYFHLLLTGLEPTEEQRFFLDLLLVAIAEHGMMPTQRRRADDAGRRPGLTPGRGRGRDPRLRPGDPRYRAGVRAAAGRAQREVAELGRDPAAVAKEIAETTKASGEQDARLRPPGPPAARPAGRADPRARRRARRQRTARAARALLARRGRRRLGTAADDERLDADRRRDARPRLRSRAPSRRSRSSPAPPACSPTSPRSSSCRSAF